MRLTPLFLPVLAVLTLAAILAQPFPLGSAAPSPRNHGGPLVLNELKHDVSPAVRDMAAEPTDEVGSEDEESGESVPSHPWQGQSSRSYLINHSKAS